MRVYPARWIIVVSVCICQFTLGASARADVNPVGTDTGELFWRYNGENRSDWVMTFDVYDPNVENWQSGWCEHYTDAETPYLHGHCTSGLPYWSPKYQQWVTAFMVNAYWDLQFSAYTRLQGVTPSYNCHGHSTGYAVAWIYTDGMGTILEEEYETSTDLDAVLEYKQLSEHIDHSKKLSGLFMEGDNVRLTTLHEKSRDSGIYMRNDLTRLLGDDAFEKK